MLGRSTAGAGRESHNLAELTKTKNYRKKQFQQKEGSIVYNDTHVNQGLHADLKNQEGSTDDHKQTYK